MSSFPHLAKKKVLIVDDEVEIVDILADEFESFGTEVSRAYSGASAAKLIDEQSFDLIVSDVRMPDFDGVELLKSIKMVNSDGPSVIFMTGYSDVSVEESANFGVVAYITKPFNLAVILSASDRVLAPYEVKWSKELETKPKFFYSIDGRESTAQKFVDSPACNIGRGGFFFSIENEALPAIGEGVEFCIKGSSDLQVKGQGIVRWCRDKPSSDYLRGIGIEIIFAPADSLPVLKAWATGVTTLSFIPRG